MKASEEVLAMIALFAPYAANTNATRLLFRCIEALERVADAARPVASGVDRGGDCTCFECENGRRLQSELDALDALEPKR